MAKIVKETSLKYRMRPYYPWHEWVDGNVWEIEQDKDFDVDPRTFQVAAYNWANRHGFKAATRLLPNGNVLLRIIKKPDADKVAE